MTQISSSGNSSTDDADSADKEGPSVLLFPFCVICVICGQLFFPLKVLGSNGVPGRSSLPKPSRAGWYYRIHRVGLGVTRIILLMRKVFNIQ